MQVLPYLIILTILPQIQGCKNIKIIKKEGKKLTSENLYQALKIQMQMQIIMDNFVAEVDKEDLLKILSKKEKYENVKYMRRLW